MRTVNPRDLRPGDRLEGVGDSPTIARVTAPAAHPEFGEVVVATFTAPDQSGATRRELPTEFDVSVLDDEEPEPPAPETPPPQPTPAPLPGRSSTTPAATRKATR